MWISFDWRRDGTAPKQSWPITSPHRNDVWDQPPPESGKFSIMFDVGDENGAPCPGDQGILPRHMGQIGRVDGALCPAIADRLHSR